MALEPTWQPNYVDLSDGDTVQFGGRCLICGARYASATEHLDPALVRSAVPGSPSAHEVEDLKYRAFVEFDEAFRELAIECYRCERIACPDCWDEDHRMCGSCVVTRGLTRSPHRGLPGTGPLADGRLRVVDRGQFGDISRPSWLNDLIAMQPDGGHPAVPPSAVADAPWMRELGVREGQPKASPAHGREPVPSFHGPDLGTFALEPTAHLTVTSGPAFSRAPQPLDYGSPESLIPERTAEYETPEGKVTSSMVECPRCGTANYDFVTRCTVCQLQLIQNCPMCEKLNPGHAQQCEYCGSPLDRPHGWSGVRNPILPLSPTEARQRQTMAPARSAPPPPPAPRRGRTGKLKAAATGLRRGSGPVAVPPPLPAPKPMPAGLDAPFVETPRTTAAYAPFEVQPYADDEPDEQHLFGSILAAIERTVSFVLCVFILAIIVAVVAAELSPQANTMIRAIIHIDVQVSLARFVAWAQAFWRRMHQ